MLIERHGCDEVLLLLCGFDEDVRIGGSCSMRQRRRVGVWCMVGVGDGLVWGWCDGGIVEVVVVVEVVVTEMSESMQRDIRSEGEVLRV